MPCASAVRLAGVPNCEARWMPLVKIPNLKEGP